MKQKLYLLSLLFLSSRISMAQSPDAIAGEYHLQGVMETASAILLKPDSTFELYFSYGAMDRQGHGKWQYQNGKILLNSRPRPERDFALVASKPAPDEFTTVKIVDSNQQILPFFETLIRTTGGEKYGKMNQEGAFQIPKTKTTGIDLFFTLAPERYTSFPVDSDDNYFEFRIEPWIIEIFVENIALKPAKNGLTGEHPLLKGDAFSYEKMK
ncbi:hypothetical protein GCM10010967_26380 [Dyadobacter beijingensis]|uniref:Uncharacterized protein n=1 Tax=Dyadobacter beijingensis TaxID=365489 RepID=A0ABQ2HVM2_9BACT|nr:hypothetical protein [Dyadobacter beijingensis]GGM92063.1 hypothetical protein GCM10010967_26380 [Dyadobacter beijingensis]